MIKDLVKLKEDLICKDGNIIPSGTQFAVDGSRGNKYRCYNDPINDDVYLIYVEKDLVEVIGKTEIEIADFFKKNS